MIAPLGLFKDEGTALKPPERQCIGHGNALDTRKHAETQNLRTLQAAGEMYMIASQPMRTNSLAQNKKNSAMRRSSVGDAHIVTSAIFSETTSSVERLYSRRPDKT
jgi:hypothetical protein